MDKHLYCVIMAGGVGSRFWPISREEKPKQFLDFSGNGRSFLRMTYERFLGIIPRENIIIVSLRKYKDLVMEHIPELPENNLLLEPYNRNTCPCLALATYHMLKRDPQAVMVATPSDLLIGDTDLFEHTISNALDYASENDALVTLGIVPDRPDTNFGYIQVVGGSKSRSEDKPVKVKTFTEKPDFELAKVFLASGEFLWNSGIFCWKAETIRKEMEKYCPSVTRPFKGWETKIGEDGERSFLEKVYMNMERMSVDYGVMEKTGRAMVYPANFGWADIGNWESLYGYLADKDGNKNAVKATNKLIQGAKSNIIYSSVGKKLVAVKDLENFVIIDTDDVLMICPRNDGKLKEVIANIGLPEFKEFR